MLAFLRVTDDLVCVIGLGEALLGLWVFALVGVVLLGKLAECLFDIRTARLAVDAEHLIGVTHIRTLTGEDFTNSKKPECLIWVISPSQSRSGCFVPPFCGGRSVRSLDSESTSQDHEGGL